MAPPHVIAIGLRARCREYQAALVLVVGVPHRQEDAGAGEHDIARFVIEPQRILHLAGAQAERAVDVFDEAIVRERIVEAQRTVVTDAGVANRRLRGEQQSGMDLKRRVQPRFVVVRAAFAALAEEVVVVGVDEALRCVSVHLIVQRKGRRAQAQYCRHGEHVPGESTHAHRGTLSMSAVSMIGGAGARNDESRPRLT